MARSVTDPLSKKRPCPYGCSRRSGYRSDDLPESDLEGRRRSLSPTGGGIRSDGGNWRMTICIREKVVVLHDEMLSDREIPVCSARVAQ